MGIDSLLIKSIAQGWFPDIDESAAVNEAGQTVDGLQDAEACRRWIWHGWGAACLLEFIDARKGRVVRQFADLLLHACVDQARSERTEVDVLAFVGVELHQHVEGSLGDRIATPAAIAVDGCT